MFSRTESSIPELKFRFQLVIASKVQSFVSRIGASFPESKFLFSGTPTS